MSSPARPSWSRKLSGGQRGPVYLVKFDNGITIAVLCDSVGNECWAVRLLEAPGAELGTLLLDCAALDQACQRMGSIVRDAGGHWEEEPEPEVYALTVIVDRVADGCVHMTVGDHDIVENAPPLAKHVAQEEALDPNRRPTAALSAGIRTASSPVAFL